ncbi:hypothetical protein DPMN_179928 [Dreissena polymorpha]|uniref:TNFR-Cys domain-containing protein n=2 Tax=Dreissena polymorpha TaxID=45954 RepID=A0A9D4EG01_DREPO|nr:hypothetical protein DPMN_179928 [Dreissena polymorpha]
MALPLILIAYLNSAYGVPTDTYRTDKGVICYLCPPGKFFVRDCSLDYDSAVCSPCPNGHYIGFNNQAYKCQPCSTVCPNTNYESFDDQPEIITANCTSISDIVCECKLEFWRESGYRGMCRRAKKCKEGYGVSAQATGYSDTICEACETGQTFSNTTSATDACLPCSKCYDHTYIRNDCRTDRDTECILLTTTEFTTRKDASRELQQGLGLGVGIPVLVACGLILVFCFIRRKRTKRQQNIPAKTVPDGQLSSSNITHIETLHIRPTSNVASIHTFNGQHVWSTSTYLPDLNDSIWSEGYPTSFATGHSDTFCEPCKAGETFSNTTSAYDPCWPCTHCDGHMSVGRACEADRDTECIPLSTTG